MKEKSIARYLLPAASILASLLLLSGTALAQQAAGQQSSPLSIASDKAPSPVPAAAPAPDWAEKLKDPFHWLSLGGDLRIREEYFDNATTLSSSAPAHEFNYQRYRARAWATIKPAETVSINARLAWEFRTYLKPDSKRGIDPDELIVDNLNVKWTNVFGKSLTVTAGRQDITLGNGWLVMEGSPMDGSRTFFFDAVRATYELKKSRTSIDMIYIDQASASDRWFAPLRDRHKSLIEQNERGAILYVTNKSIKKVQLDGYFIYKHDMRVLANGNDSDIYAFGARMEGEAGEHWKYRMEAAPELGSKNGRDLRAFGLNSRLSYFLKDRINNNFRVGYGYLSGDDPSTPENEGFDPLWGRWPQWSELLIYTMPKETRVSEMTNMHRIVAGWSCNPTSRMEVSADIHTLLAPQNPMRGKRGFSSDGRVRGEMFNPSVRYTFSKHLAGRLLGEFFMPGSYYSVDSRDRAVFYRAEMILKW